MTMGLILYVSFKTRKEVAVKPRKKQIGKSVENKKDAKLKEKQLEDKQQDNVCNVYGYNHKITLSRFILLLVFVAFCISIPWEFFRLYQTEVAKRASAMQAGTPPECIPDQMTVYQSIKYWIQWQLSWQHDPCEKYHKLVLVDPLLEIPPLMVLFSAFTRCVLHPLELLCAGVGKGFKLFFSEIPAIWQPVMLVIFLIVFIITMTMTCGYRISLPFLLKIEPKTPILGRFKSLISHDNDVSLNVHVVPEKKTLKFSDN